MSEGQQSTRSETKARVPLIVDSDSTFLDSLTSEAASLADAPLVASSIQQGLEILLVKKSSIGVLVVSTSFGREQVKDMIFAAHRMLPGLPVALISSEDAVRFSDEELRKMVVQYILRKPLKYVDIVVRLKSQPLARKRAEQADADFAPVMLDADHAGESQIEDVYVKIRGGRYIKILKAGYAIGRERLDRYLRRGVKNFYRSKK